jgi:hypothetical protein
MGDKVLTQTAAQRSAQPLAAGLYGSFISRNNDVAGYWGIGKLCLLAQQRRTTIVRLDLVAGSIAPESAEFAKLVSGYVAMLKTHLSARKIPESWIGT